MNNVHHEFSYYSCYFHKIHGVTPGSPACENILYILTFLVCPDFIQVETFEALSIPLHSSSYIWQKPKRVIIAMLLSPLTSHIAFSHQLSPAPSWRHVTSPSLPWLALFWSQSRCPINIDDNFHENCFHIPSRRI